MTVKQIPNVKSGTTVPIPTSASAWRIVPSSGQSGFPRDVQLNSGQIVTRWSPEWHRSDPEGGINIPALSYPGGYPANTPAWSDELWTVEYATEDCDELPQIILPPVQLLWQSPQWQQYQTNANPIQTPPIYTPQWRAVMHTLIGKAGTPSNGGWLLRGFDSRGNAMAAGGAIPANPSSMGIVHNGGVASTTGIAATNFGGSAMPPWVNVFYNDSNYPAQFSIEAWGCR